jgi:hypothetical protein
MLMLKVTELLWFVTEITVAKVGDPERGAEG